MGNATDKQGGPFIYAEGQNDAGQPDDTVSVSAHFISRSESVIEDLIHNAELQHRATCWHKGMNSDLVDSKHASYLTSSVNGTDVDHPNFNDTTPAAAGGGTNVKFQVSGSDVSAYLPSGSAGPVDAQYLTLATNATLTNERVLTEGLGIDFADAGAGSTLTVTLDLGEISTGTPSGADTFVFVDADDQIGRRGTAADMLVALGAASSSTAVTAASAWGASGHFLYGDGTGRAAKTDTPSTDGAGNWSGIGTLASGAHTITQATVGTVFRTEVSTATNDDPTEKFYHGRGTTSENAGVVLFNFTPAADKRYTMEATVLVRQTAGAGTGTGRTIKIIADIEEVGGTVTVTIVSNVAGGTLAVTSCTVNTAFGIVNLTCQVEAVAGSGKTYVHHAKIALFGPVGT